MLDLVVRGGTVVAPWGVGPWDVAVKDGRIVSVSEPGSLTNDAVRVVDAKGKIVVPGGVEPHAHCSWTVPTLAHEGVSTGSIEDVSRACLFGGHHNAGRFRILGARRGPVRDPGEEGSHLQGQQPRRLLLSRLSLLDQGRPAFQRDGGRLGR